MSTAKKSASLTDQLHGIVGLAGRFSPLLFAILLAGAYGFIILQIITAHSAAPSADSSSNPAQAIAIPRVDPQTVQDIQNLQDHSVNVKTLFDTARSNPFHE